MRQFRVLVNGNEYKVAIEELQETSASAPAITAPPEQAKPPAPKPIPQSKSTAASNPKPDANDEASGIITAAMPGTILEVKAAEGDTVVRGEALLILEAMKMENEIMAPCDGVISEIHVAVGASVNSGDLLIVIS
ncbi:MAG: acetyl-CoA carboxylase biotin carboxyl carrier protein subunit [Desulfobacterales bacterium]|nr:acetyl-CoA carboxylase biotin carboxyl carrier protein subunit [Deltaproteobacteria bacterium]NNK96784.1 acetyl-CoA carboxylase biotin carboxyl carrier protein subunit [Desulfobacterales bacterium]